MDLACQGAEWIFGYMLSCLPLRVGHPMLSYAVSDTGVLLSQSSTRFTSKNHLKIGYRSMMGSHNSLLCKLRIYIPRASNMKN